MSAEVIMALCAPVDALPNEPVPGCIVVKCSRCPRFVWVAPSLQRVLDRATVVCTSCGIAEMEAAAARGDPPIFGGMLPGQREEIQEALKKRQP